MPGVLCGIGILALSIYCQSAGAGRSSMELDVDVQANNSQISEHPRSDAGSIWTTLVQYLHSKNEDYKIWMKRQKAYSRNPRVHWSLDFDWNTNGGEAKELTASLCNLLSAIPELNYGSQTSSVERIIAASDPRISLDMMEKSVPGEPVDEEVPGFVLEDDIIPRRIVFISVSKEAEALQRTLQGEAWADIFGSPDETHAHFRVRFQLHARNHFNIDAGSGQLDRVRLAFEVLPSWLKYKEKGPWYELWGMYLGYELQLPVEGASLPTRANPFWKPKDGVHIGDRWDGEDWGFV